MSWIKWKMKSETIVTSKNKEIRVRIFLLNLWQSGPCLFGLAWNPESVGISVMTARYRKHDIKMTTVERMPRNYCHRFLCLNWQNLLFPNYSRRNWNNFRDDIFRCIYYNRARKKSSSTTNLQLIAPITPQRQSLLEEMRCVSARSPRRNNNYLLPVTGCSVAPEKSDV